eukprot:SAG11_NODE_3182_length_2626_cov_1.994460_1_plen_875_part_11
MEMLEVLASSTPRKDRKAVREVLERAEAVAESVNDEWVEGLMKCRGEPLDRLGSVFATIREADASSAHIAAQTMEMLNCLERCGSAAVQTMAVLSSDMRGSAGQDAVVSALETLRGMTRESLAIASADEVSAVDAVLLQLEADGSSSEVRVSANMAFYTLGCRNGLAVCGSVETADRVCVCALAEWDGYTESSDSTAFDTLSAASASCFFITFEGVPKTPSALRAALEARNVAVWAKVLAMAGKWTDEIALSIITKAHEDEVLDQTDTSLACGAACALFFLTFMHSRLAVVVADLGVFTAAWRLHRRVCPVIPSAEWWSSKAAVVDVLSAQMTSSSLLPSVVKVLPAGRARSLDVWVPMLSNAIEMMKMNQVARLSSGDTMSMFLFNHCMVVECAARDCTQHAALLSSGVVDALEFACANDFAVLGVSLAAYAAGAVTELVGRNEEGKTLSRETVFAVLSKAATWFNENHFMYSTPPANALKSFSPRVSTMVISDANKRIMLEFDGLVDMLVKYLLVDSPRRGEKGGDAMQEAAAELILTLALFEPMAKAMRAEGSGVLEGLRGVLADDSATEGGVRSAKQALFQLETDEQPRGDGGGGGGGGPVVGSGSGSGSGRASKHVMVSYCWAQQPVVKRIHAALVCRGYAVWIDVEQMKGSTVDSMALAVEGASVMLMGVSRQYKESTNCRLEAQYAMQREVEAVPLMLEEGYQADGWLGFMIGTRLWYGFYGAVLSTESLFEVKMSELCRELGERGRGTESAAVARYSAVADAAGSENVRAGVVSNATCYDALISLTNRELRARARASGASAAQLDSAADADDSHGALAELLMELTSTPPSSTARVKTLVGLSNKQLRARAKQAGATAAQLDAASDAD